MACAGFRILAPAAQGLEEDADDEYEDDDDVGSTAIQVHDGNHDGGDEDDDEAEDYMERWWRQNTRPTSR